MFIDTHAHLGYMIGKEDADLFTTTDLQLAKEMLSQMRSAGVASCITVGTNAASSAGTVALANALSGVYATVGLHPSDVNPNWVAELAKIEILIKKHKQGGKLVAIGECGLDYYRPGYDEGLQKRVFVAQIELALVHGLPIVVHTRQAAQDTLALFDQYQGKGLRGVFHCFSETPQYALEVVKRGFYVGIGGAVTYPKNDHLREVVRTIGLTAIVLETDAPFLAPQAKRGQPNTPAFIPFIADEVARILQVPVAEVAEKTTKNAFDLFGLRL